MCKTKEELEAYETHENRLHGKTRGELVKLVRKAFGQVVSMSGENNLHPSYMDLYLYI